VFIGEKLLFFLKKLNRIRKAFAFSGIELAMQVNEGDAALLDSDSYYFGRSSFIILYLPQQA